MVATAMKPWWVFQTTTCSWPIFSQLHYTWCCVESHSSSGQFICLDNYEIVQLHVSHFISFIYFMCIIASAHFQYLEGPLKKSQYFGFISSFPWIYLSILLFCNLSLKSRSMASSFKKNYVLADSSSSSAWQLLCSWDFNITNERAVRQRKNNLRVQLTVIFVLQTYFY